MKTFGIMVLTNEEHHQLREIRKELREIALRIQKIDKKHIPHFGINATLTRCEKDLSKIACRLEVIY